MLVGSLTMTVVVRAQTPWVMSVVALAIACGCDGPADGLFEQAEPEVFAGHDGPRSARGFDVLATDMDADGDPDVLINWHHLGPMELFENRSGQFQLLNGPENDSSGLVDNPGSSSLFVAHDEMRASIADAPESGLYVWHDLDRRQGSWRFEFTGSQGFVLEMTTSLGFDEVVGLEMEEVASPSERERLITVEHGSQRLNFSVRTVQVTPRLHLRLTSSTGEPLPIFVGRGLTAHPGGEVELWKPDPHGIAWVNVEGSRRPEMFVTRGGLMGKLVEPLAPKHDRYYRQGESGDALYARAALGVVPADHGRGRTVEWVDVDNDGSLELSVGNEGTPNKLLRREADTGRFHDVAARYGLDLEGAEVQSWADFDRDGWQDLYFLADGAVDVLRNTKGGAFERLSGVDLGLVLPSLAPAAESLFDFGALRLADFDSDGDLDVWVLMFGRGERTNHLFRRDGDRFVDVTEEAGLNAIAKNIFALLCDVDNDGFEDVISNGDLEGDQRRALLWHNRRGQHFNIGGLGGLDQYVHFGTNLDVNADGRWDLVLIGRERHLLRNIGRSNSWLDIDLRGGANEPIGAVVKVHCSDGHVIARRYGSAYNTAYSQVLGPLRFGVADGITATSLSIQWPGEATERVYPAPALGAVTTIER